MDILVHIYLSGSSEEIKVGNFIGDYVKGNQYEQFPGGIREGVILHRRIDDYTDRHKCIKNSKHLISAELSKYSGVLVDVFYAHFLAVNWNRFSFSPLDDFMDDVNQILDKYRTILPTKVKNFLNRFIEERWFEQYLTIEGLITVLNRLSKRTILPYILKDGVADLKENYNKFKQGFFTFFPAIIKFVEITNQISFNIPDKEIVKMVNNQ
jgi:acyl carrier protein phosphodiesterase